MQIFEFSIVCVQLILRVPRAERVKRVCHVVFIALNVCMSVNAFMHIYNTTSSETIIRSSFDGIN